MDTPPTFIVPLNRDLSCVNRDFERAKVLL